jgi:CheY-like chemotaxis protein
MRRRWRSFTGTKLGRSRRGRIDEIPDPALPGCKIRDIPNGRFRVACDNPHVSRTVLIVDDHAGFRGLARRLLEASGFTVVGEAGDGASALAAVKLLRPRLVLLDVMLPDTDGFAIAERLAADGAETIVVLTSSRDAADFGQRLLASPARGFIHKGDLSGGALARLADDPS